MIHTALAKRALAVRRDHRDMPKAGWEYVGEGGGKLWELNRGYRIGHRIAEVKIAADGVGVWVKTVDEFAREVGRKVPNLGVNSPDERPTDGRHDRKDGG
jgi:hypothetical protein